MSYNIVHNIETHRFEDYIIYHKEGFGVLNIKKGEIDLTLRLRELSQHPHFHIVFQHLYNNEEYLNILRTFMFEFYDLAKNIETENGKLYCFISTHVFECLTPYTQTLRHAHFYIDALRFWLKIANLTEEWESNNLNRFIHKGALYGYIGETYMYIGDAETSFTYLHRAVKEDVRISSYIPEYPQAAPSYRVIKLKPSTNHFMSNYVVEVRKLLSSGIDAFANNFEKYSNFNLEQLDKIFIENTFFDTKNLDEIRIIALFSLWQTYYYLYKVGDETESSIFDNLNRLNKLFGICIIIESLGKQFDIANDKFMEDRCANLYQFIGGKKNIRQLISKVKRKDDKIDDLIRELLDFDNKKFQTLEVDKLDRCVLIYYLIRNFTAHNIESKSYLGIKFTFVAQKLLFLTLIILIELYKSCKSRVEETTQKSQIL